MFEHMPQKQKKPGIFFMPREHEITECYSAVLSTAGRLGYCGNQCGHLAATMKHALCLVTEKTSFLKTIKKKSTINMSYVAKILLEV